MRTMRVSILAQVLDQAILRLGGAAALEATAGAEFWSSARCLGVASTSYSTPALSSGTQVRSYAAKPAKGKPAAAAPKDAGKPQQQLVLKKRPSPMLRLKMRFRSTPDQLQLLPPALRQAAQELVPPAAPPTPAAAGEQAVAAEEQESAELKSFRQIGVPLSQRDAVRLMHDSLSGVAGEQVQLRPFVFSNIFQSAPVVASYVANALETGTAWPRVERFFLSCVEADPAVAAMRVEINGRMGRKASMASTKVWSHGDIRLIDMSEATDYGQAVAMTRLGVTGVKVWIRYTREAAADFIMRRKTGFSMPLHRILTARRDPLPMGDLGAWWSKPGPQQPVVNRTWEALAPDYAPYKQSVGSYLGVNRPLLFKTDVSRRQYIAKHLTGPQARLTDGKGSAKAGTLPPQGSKSLTGKP